MEKLERKSQSGSLNNAGNNNFDNHLGEFAIINYYKISKGGKKNYDTVTGVLLDVYPESFDIKTGQSVSRYNGKISSFVTPKYLPKE